MYEVHISRQVGTPEESGTDTIEVEPGRSFALSMHGSLFMRTPDRELAEHVAHVHEQTARRSDDRHAWIREVA